MFAQSLLDDTSVVLYFFLFLSSLFSANLHVNGNRLKRGLLNLGKKLTRIFMPSGIFYL